jgi:hypothetical protein
MCPQVTLGGDELRVASGGRGLPQGVTSSCGGNGWPCEIARGFEWPRGVMGGHGGFSVASGGHIRPLSMVYKCHKL